MSSTTFIVDPTAAMILSRQHAEELRRLRTGATTSPSRGRRRYLRHARLRKLFA